MHRKIQAIAFSILMFACGSAGRKQASYSTLDSDNSMHGGDTYAEDVAQAVSTSPRGGRTAGAFVGGNVQGRLNLSLGAGTLSVVNQKQEQLVVEGWLTVVVADVGKVANAVRKQVEQMGGRVVDEQLKGDADGGARFGSMKLRVPPDGVKSLLAWVGEQGNVSGKRIRGTEMSRQLFEQQIALDNFNVTLKRLRQLLTRSDLDVKAVLEIEKEMTRVRGQIEAIKGQNRFLKDLVAMATITLSITRDEHVVFAPDAKFHLGPRLNTLFLTSPGNLKKTRLGGGVMLHFTRSFTFDFDVFSDPADEGSAIITTVGGAVYSEFLGNGQRSFFNPFIGYRLGYGYLDRESHFVAAAELGVELFKNDWLLIDVTARGLGFVSDNSHFAVQTTFGVIVPF